MVASGCDVAGIDNVDGDKMMVIMMVC